MPTPSLTSKILINDNAPMMCLEIDHGNGSIKYSMQSLTIIELKACIYNIYICLHGIKRMEVQLLCTHANSMNFLGINWLRDNNHLVETVLQRAFRTTMAVLWTPFAAIFKTPRLLYNLNQKPMSKKEKRNIFNLSPVYFKGMEKKQSYVYWDFHNGTTQINRTKNLFKKM